MAERTYQPEESTEAYRLGRMYFNLARANPDGPITEAGARRKRVFSELAGMRWANEPIEGWDEVASVPSCGRMKLYRVAA